MPTSPLEDQWIKFPDLYQAPTGPALVKHTTTHHTETRGPLQVSKPWRPAPDKLKATKQQVRQQLDSGTLRPSKSSWASPINLQPKGDSASSGSAATAGDLTKSLSLTATLSLTCSTSLMTSMDAKFFQGLSQESLKSNPSQAL